MPSDTLIDDRARPGSASTARGPRAEQRRQSRQRLLAAARELCAEGRFLSCAVSDIADKAELSRAGFYLHFKSKEDLFGAVMADQLDWYVDQHDTMTEQRAASTEGIIAWLEQFVEGFRTAGELLVQFWMASPADEIVRQQQANRLRGIEALGRRLPALRLFRPDGAPDPERLRHVLLFTYQLEQACMNVAYSDDAGDARAMLELVADGLRKLMRD